LRRAVGGRRGVSRRPIFPRLLRRHVFQRRTRRGRPGRGRRRVWPRRRVGPRRRPRRRARPHPRLGRQPERGAERTGGVAPRGPRTQPTGDARPRGRTAGFRCVALADANSCLKAIRRMERKGSEFFSTPKRLPALRPPTPRRPVTASCRAGRCAPAPPWPPVRPTSRATPSSATPGASWPPACRPAPAPAPPTRRAAAPPSTRRPPVV